MFINYKRTVNFDATIINAGLNAEGLITCAQKNTTGAPSAVAGKYIPGALIQNAVSGIIYQNTGSTASPVFTAISPTAIANGSVTLAKLATAIAPSHVVKFAGTATGGTTATRAYTVTGALSTDVASAVIRASQNAATIEKATLTTNTLTVLFSTDPGTGTSVDYSILRATA